MSSALPVPELTEHTISTARHTMGYIASGREEGPLMIFVHGWRPRPQTRPSLCTARHERAVSSEVEIAGHRCRGLLLRIEEVPNGGDGGHGLFFHQPVSRI